MGSGEAMSPLWVSYYTPDYAGEAAALEKTLKEWGLEYELIRRESTGQWVRNCAAKAEVVLDAIRRHRGRPVIWIDADARIVAEPIWFGTVDCDIAAHLLYGNTLISACVYFAPTPAAYKLVVRWVEAMRATPEVWDQKVLHRLISKLPVRFADMPPEYCWIEGHTLQDRLSFRAYGARHPVIEQWQASRKFRDGRADA
jgi:hypothetical protein